MKAKFGFGKLNGKIKIVFCWKRLCAFLSGHPGCDIQQSMVAKVVGCVVCVSGEHGEVCMCAYGDQMPTLFIYFLIDSHLSF